MNLTALALICLVTQAVVVGAVFYFLTSTSRRPTLVRGIGIFLFAGLEAAILLHIIIARAGGAVETKDVLIDIALAALVALAFGFGNSLLNLLHRSRRALKHSESLSSTLFEQSSEPVMILDKSGNLIEVNGTACEQLGFSKNELFKFRMIDIVHPDELSAVQERMSKMVPGEIARIAVRVRKKDGSWMQSDTSSRRLDDGTFLTIARDITDQIKQQRSLERFAEVSSGSGDQFFSSVVQSLVESLDLEHVLIGELLPGRTDRVTTLALMLDSKPAANVEYDLAGAPCNNVVGKSIACYPSDLQKMFPDDTLLRDIGAVSYVGTPLFASNGTPLGLICALSRRPITNQSYSQTVLACYSHRVESEIERLRAEAALRESEERYSNVVNVSPFGMHMYRLEADGRLILEAANPAADWLLGIDHSKLLGKTIEEAFPSLANTEVPEQYRRIAAHGERWHNESITYKDNRIEGAFEVVAFQRSLMKMAAVFMNITDRKQAEEALRESETGLANAQRITHIGSWSMDPLRKKCRWSAEMYRICGLSPREEPPWVDEYVDKIVHPDDRQQVHAAIEGLLKGRGHQPLEYRVIRPDGSIRICQTQSTIDLNSAGRPDRISGTTQDITERKLAEEALQSSEERYRNFVANASEGIFRVEFTQPIRIDESPDVIADRVTRYAVVSEVNEALATIYKLRPEEMTGQPVRRFAPECGAHLVELLKTTDYRITDREVASYTADGSQIYTVESYFGIVENGQLIRVWGVERDVTDRKRTEEALKLASERLALATHSAGVGIWDLDLATDTLVWDDSMYHLYGITPAAFTGAYEAWKSCVHPDDLARADAEVQQALRGEKEFDTEFRVVWPDRTVRHIKAYAHVQRDDSGRPVRFIGTNWDITERKCAEAMLRRQNEFLIALRESTLDLVSGLDLDELLTSIVKRAGQLLGTTAGYIGLLEPGADHLTPKITLGAMAKEPLNPAIHPGEGLSGMVWQTGQAIIVDDFDTWPGRIAGDEINEFQSIAAVPLVTKSGVVGVLGLAYERGSTRTFDAESVERLKEFARFAALAVETAQLNDAVRRELIERKKEITVRNQVEEDLQRSLSLLCATLESTADGILVVDDHGDVAGYNRKFLEYWRIPVTFAEQKDDARLIAYVLDQLKDPDGFVQKVKDLYANPSAESFDTLEFRDGRYFERYSLPQRMGNDIIGRVWSFRDVTERKRAELERTRLEEQLRLSQKLETTGTLAASIAHDFNNLLLPVIGYTELADSDLSPEDPKHGHLAEVLKAAYRAKSLVGQILAFSRQQSGESRLVRLESVVDEAARLLRSTLEPNIILETSAESNLPRIFADTTQLHQVIMNLCVNASHAMKNGGKLTIAVKATSAEVSACRVCACQLFGVHLELCVADTGHGMDQATLQRIFDPFFTTKPVGEGTGLGLAVTHGIVAHHGGHICAISEVGTGSAFHIYLPAVEDCEHETSLTNAERILAVTQIPVS